MLRERKSECEVAQSYPTLRSMDCSLPASSVHGIFQEEYWSGLPFLSPGHLLNSGIKHGCPALQAVALPSGSPEPPGERKVAFNQNAWKLLKEIREAVSEWSPSPHCVQSCQLPIFLCILSCFTLFVHEITEGEARKAFWSSVSYLFFISTSLIYRKNQLIRQSIVWSKDLKDVLGVEMSRAREYLV